MRVLLLFGIRHLTECFEIIIKTVGRSTYSSKRVLCFSPHKNAVSQIYYISHLGLFASSSLDGTILMWSFDYKSKEYKIIQKFKDLISYLLLSFFMIQSICYLYITHPLIHLVFGDGNQI